MPQQYVQLLSSNGNVISQRAYSGQPLSYYQDKIWRVSAGQVIRIVDHSELVQPHKFMEPVSRDAKVMIYSFEDCLKFSPHEPSEHLALYSLKASEVATIENELSDLKGGWNAFVSGVWVGTSEC